MSKGDFNGTPSLYLKRRVSVVAVVLAVVLGALAYCWAAYKTGSGDFYAALGCQDAVYRFRNEHGRFPSHDELRATVSGHYLESILTTPEQPGLSPRYVPPAPDATGEVLIITSSPDRSWLRWTATVVYANPNASAMRLESIWFWELDEIQWQVGFAAR